MRGIYDDLIWGTSKLCWRKTALPTILSSLSMTYFGNLAQALPGVAKRLEPGGFNLFSSEAKAGEGWEQTTVHRFRHSEVYLRGAAASAGLQFVDIMACTLRHEEHQPVPGFAVALRKLVG